MKHLPRERREHCERRRFLYGIMINPMAYRTCNRTIPTSIGPFEDVGN